MVAIRTATGKVISRKPFTGRGLVARAVSILVGLTFSYAGLVKIASSAAFAENVASFRLLPSTVNNAFALGLPPFEILLGAWLVCGWRRRTAAFCATLASGIFLFALTSAWVRGLAVECGCFGLQSSKHPLGVAIGRDLLMLTATLFLYQRNAAVPPAV